MSFSTFKQDFQNNFAKLTENASRLFEVEVDKDKLWDIYLNSFTSGNDIFRERRAHDCSCCRHFIRTIGNAVVIKNNEVHTLWEFQPSDPVYQPVVEALHRYIARHLVTNVYISKDTTIGTDKNFERLANGNILEWEHLYLQLPSRFVDRSRRSVGDLQGELRDTRNVFKRSLEEISQDAVKTVLELIASDSLYRGSEHKAVLEMFLVHKNAYSQLQTGREKENYAWEKSFEAGAVVGRIRNHSIGTLLVDISEGTDLDIAVKKYENIVAPANYKRSKPIFTARMLEDAKKTIEELGYMASLERRHATLDDININNILFSNKDAAKRISGVGVFDEMMQEATANPKKFSRVEEMPIAKFIADVLPSASSVEAYIENKHINNMVSLIAPKNADAKTMFKWNNGFSWAYTGNLTDSMKERVKSAGGKVDGDLRFSIQWNETNEDNCDLDAHCREANGFELYFGAGRKPMRSPTNGQLDVDIINPGHQTAVENITWPSRKTMKPGTYRFYVHQFSGSAKRGFRAEIEFDGQIYSFDYSNSMRRNERVDVAEVTLSADGVFTIKQLLPSSVSSKDVWGIKTNCFVPVSVIMHSPNYWDGQNGIGNKHYFFMLKDCVNAETPNGFYNEFLKQELVQHKRVFEALGGRMAVEKVDDQLSGIGFSSTMRNDLVVKVKGATERTIKIKF